jgi:hypothetical protein
MSIRLAKLSGTEGPVAEVATENTLVAATAQSRNRRQDFAWRLPVSLRAGSPTWTWVGVLVVAAGFVLLAVAWGQVAGETQVYLQVPYVVSAALVGLGLIMVGLTVVSIAARQQDATARDHQIEQLLVSIDELKDALAKPKGRQR